MQNKTKTETVKPKVTKLKQIGFLIKGVSKCEMWGGGVGYRKMDAFKLPLKKITTKILLKNINDGQFGVANILGAFCEIYELYENNYTEHAESLFVGEIKEEEKEHILECFYNMG